MVFILFLTDYMNPETFTPNIKKPRKKNVFFLYLFNSDHLVFINDLIKINDLSFLSYQFLPLY